MPVHGERKGNLVFDKNRHRWVRDGVDEKHMHRSGTLKEINSSIRQELQASDLYHDHREDFNDHYQDILDEKFEGYKNTLDNFPDSRGKYRNEMDQYASLSLAVGQKQLRNHLSDYIEDGILEVRSGGADNFNAAFAEHMYSDEKFEEFKEEVLDKYPQFLDLLDNHIEDHDTDTVEQAYEAMEFFAIAATMNQRDEDAFDAYYEYAHDYLEYQGEDLSDSDEPIRQNIEEISRAFGERVIEEQDYESIPGGRKVMEYHQELYNDYLRDQYNIAISSVTGIKPGKEYLWNDKYVSNYYSNMLR